MHLLKFMAPGSHQRGFTIVELLMVLAIVGLLSILAIPGVKGIMIDGRVQPTADDVLKTVAKMRGTFAVNSSAPFATLGTPADATAAFANSARSLANTLRINGVGTAATMQHDLGAPAAAVTAAPSTLNVVGDAFDVTFGEVNDHACPSLASQLQKTAEVVSINGINVKSQGGAYNAGAAQTSCTADNTNTFVFTFR